MTDLEQIYETNPGDYNDSWRHDWGQADEEVHRREWERLFWWEEANWPSRRREIHAPPSRR